MKTAQNLSRKFSKEYLIALSQAFFVTILWSSSWVIIKFGLKDIPPLIFAGLRYTLGATILCTYIFSKHEYRNSIKGQSKQVWLQISIYGLLFITITQGTQFLGLSLLPAITVSFVLNLSTFLVIILSIGILKEYPSHNELFFFLFVLIGIILYFYPVDFESATFFGLIVVIVGVLTNAFSSILGRSINRTKEISPVILTGLSMMIGSTVLLICGLAYDGVQIIFSLTLLSIIYIIWLGIVNTALAFTLWNNAMRKLRAMDITVINSTMMPQIVILSIFFLGEFPMLKEWIGLILLAFSVLAIQYIQAKKDAQSTELTI
ncbi:MAG: DMT family transporter [Candidatus Hodarchaeota archaeon]